MSRLPLSLYKPDELRSISRWLRLQRRNAELIIRERDFEDCSNVALVVCP